MPRRTGASPGMHEPCIVLGKLSTKIMQSDSKSEKASRCSASEVTPKEGS